MITVMMITDGRKEYFEKTFESAHCHLFGPILRYVIIDDSNDPTYHNWLVEWVAEANDTIFSVTAPHFVFPVYPDGKKMGFGGAIRYGWTTIMDTFPRAQWIFHLEEDFTFNEDIQLGDMIQVLAKNPKLAQLCLLRQPWNQEEIAAGGIIQLHPEDFTETTTPVENRIPGPDRNWITRDFKWVRNNRCFSTNPCLYSTDIMKYGWPQCPNSEGIFTMKLLDAGYHFGFWGGKDDPPKVHHIGINRTGTGY